MRPIKFRAWDKKAMQWEELDSFTPMNPLTGKLMKDEDNSCSDPECCGGPNPMFADQEHYIIEQYTGLKDKNGVEIYEGDILRLDEDDIFVGKVWFREDKAAFAFDELSLAELICGDPDSISLEVIGNIRENPELLEPK